ncbi:hypothetical protein GN244_ATG18053 [Phytophthora infestans]|uniref:Uncharacterized protein n=1 Tax=Phytophthora infestans TaxID=4787 RepID=A0A833W525_PHYIN|nr:hypothetical protein GN244_ATG18052 [Phytophthora infestans]KAF4030183.1 hypothetical protein GN244_ATG18053 [Phytophthora infestans]KAF4137317.1 hypothetical protein GN958_ATG13486 [Phytophthora infestans]KAF4137318.1 hypothetical protein GN958_ATG13487 [Phytophthora infestans]
MCTIGEDKVVIEICNASTDECWARKRTVMALASVVPKSDFGYVTRPQKESLMVQAYQRKVLGAP